MGSLVQLSCACGASQHVPADRVEAGRLPPCRNCGGPLQAGTPLPAEADLPDSAAPLAPLAPIASGAGASRPSDGGELRCPACGGPCKLLLRGAEGRDRMLACGFCGTKVDLPEARGFTRERVTERPDERIVERVTQWESLGGEAVDPTPAAGQDDIGASIAVAEGFEVNGQRFDSREALAKHLRDILPEDAAARILSRISGSQAGDPSVWTRVEEIESTTVLGGTRRAGRRAPSRPGFRGLLARIRKLFG